MVLGNTCMKYSAKPRAAGPALCAHTIVKYLPPFSGWLIDGEVNLWTLQRGRSEIPCHPFWQASFFPSWFVKVVVPKVIAYVQWVTRVTNPVCWLECSHMGRHIYSHRSPRYQLQGPGPTYCLHKHRSNINLLPIAGLHNTQRHTNTTVSNLSHILTVIL